MCKYKYILNEALCNKMLEENVRQANIIKATNQPNSYISAICNNKKVLELDSFLNILVKAFEMKKEDAKKYLIPLAQKKAKMKVLEL